MATHERRVVFFDLDGTLHQQDMFGSFLRYLLRRQPLNALLVLPLLPIIAIALLIKGRAARWPMSLLLWGCTFGHSEALMNPLMILVKIIKLRWIHILSYDLGKSVGDQRCLLSSL